MTRLTMLPLILLVAASAPAQTKKTTPEPVLPISYFKTVDPCSEEAWSSSVSFDEVVADGIYTAKFVDICNKWRCYVTSSSSESATIVCTKPHKVLETPAPKKGQP